MDQDCDNEIDYRYEYEEEDDDYLDYCNSNKIVEMTIRRDFLLLKLQELVDAETPQQAQAAIAAMNRETGSDEQLLKFLVRAGTFEIIQKRLLEESAQKAVQKEDPGDHCPDGSNDAAATTTATATVIDSSRAGGLILSPSVARPLLKKLSFYHEQRRLKCLEKKQRRMDWTRIVRIS